MKLAAPSIRDGVGHYNVLADEDGGVLDSGAIRHFKIKLRKRLAREPGGRMVMEQEKMWTICKEVWADIRRPQGVPPLFQKMCRDVGEVRGRQGQVDWVGKTVLPPMASACKLTFILTG